MLIMWQTEEKAYVFLYAKTKHRSRTALLGHGMDQTEMCCTIIAGKE